MPSVKIPRKSTATDRTPFVDVAFLILSFFMLATKFKPPQPVEITTPTSVSTEKLKESNSVLVEFDSVGRVFFSVNIKNGYRADSLREVILKNVAQQKGISLTEEQIQNFKINSIIGVPFKDLSAALRSNPSNRYTDITPTGIPTDSANNELEVWVGAAKRVLINMKAELEGQASANNEDAIAELEDFGPYYMISGDNDAKYPQFDGVIEAFRRNDQFVFKLLTDPEEAPANSEFARADKFRQQKRQQDEAAKGAAKSKRKAEKAKEE